MYKRPYKIFTPANALMFVCTCIIVGAGVFYRMPDNPEPKEYGVELDARVVEHPDVRADKTILTVQPIIGPSGDPIESRIRVSAGNMEEYSYGEILQLKGTVKEPENFADFNWRGYLAKENIAYEMYYPEIKKTGQTKKGAAYYASALRQKLQEGLESRLLPPHDSLYSAMVLADKSGLSEARRNSLAAAGLSHIVAISGMHIAVILLMILGVLLAIGIWRRQASVLAILLIAGYIFMIGAPASAVRAGIMAGVLILGQFLGRPSFSWRALLFAGAVMVLANPYIVRYDIGFQLSFLAVLGIILFFRHIERLLKKLQHAAVAFLTQRPVTKDQPAATYAAEGNFGFTSILAVTLATQALTFPLIIYNFGSFALVSPLTNLLVVPLLPAVLVSGFAASMVPPAVSPMVGTIAAAPAWMFSEYIWWVVGVFS